MEQQRFTINRGKEMAKVFAPLIIILMVQYFLSLIIMQVVLVIDMAHYSADSFYDFMNQFMEHCNSVNVNVALALFYSIVCLIAFGWWYLKHETTIDRIRHPFKNITSNIPILITGIVLLVLGMQYFTIYLVNSLGAMFPEWLAEYASLEENNGMNGQPNIAVVIYGVLLGPIVEELAFRGITFKSAKKIMPFMWANIVQAILFSALHMNMIQSIYTFILGLILGYVMQKYDNILVSIMIHIAFNLLGSGLMQFLVIGGTSPASFFAWFLGSMIVAYAGIVLVIKAAPRATES